MTDVGGGPSGSRALATCARFRYTRGEPRGEAARGGACGRRARAAGPTSPARGRRAWPVRRGVAAAARRMQAMRKLVHWCSDVTVAEGSAPADLLEGGEIASASLFGAASRSGRASCRSGPRRLGRLRAAAGAHRAAARGAGAAAHAARDPAPCAPVHRRGARQARACGMLLRHLARAPARGAVFDAARAAAADRRPGRRRRRPMFATAARTSRSAPRVRACVRRRRGAPSPRQLPRRHVVLAVADGAYVRRGAPPPAPRGGGWAKLACSTRDAREARAVIEHAGDEDVRASASSTSWAERLRRSAAAAAPAAAAIHRALPRASGSPRAAADADAAKLERRATRWPRAAAPTWPDRLREPRAARARATAASFRCSCARVDYGCRLEDLAAVIRGFEQTNADAPPSTRWRRRRAAREAFVADAALGRARPLHLDMCAGGGARRPARPLAADDRGRRPKNGSAALRHVDRAVAAASDVARRILKRIYHRRAHRRGAARRPWRRRWRARTSRSSSETWRRSANTTGGGRPSRPRCGSRCAVAHDGLLQERPCSLASWRYIR